MSTIRELTDEIHETNERLGWNDNGNTWGELLALLGSEIFEMVGQYRVRRLASYTTAFGKPDDVASELADTVIRLLSMYRLRHLAVFEMDLELADVETLDMEDENYGDDTFGDWVFWLARVSTEMWDNPTWNGARFLRACVTFADRWGIDLTAAVERKMTYNQTRERHHGGTLSDRPRTATDLPHPPEDGMELVGLDANRCPWC